MDKMNHYPDAREAAIVRKKPCWEVCKWVKTQALKKQVEWAKYEAIRLLFGRGRAV